MIRINDDYFVDVDENNYVLCYDYHTVKKAKDGSEAPSFKKIGYFSNLATAFKRCAEEITRGRLKDIDVNLQEACQIVRDCYKEIDDLLRESLQCEVDK